MLHVDKLRPFVLPSTQGWDVPQQFWPRISANWQVEKEDFAGFGASLSDLLDMDWAGANIYVGFRLRECGLIWEKAKREKPSALIWGVPELPCVGWYKEVEAASSRWMVVNQARSRLEDDGGNEVGNLACKVWLVLTVFDG